MGVVRKFFFTWSEGFQTTLLRLEAASDITRLAQQRRENQWTVHPSLDGCYADIITQIVDTLLSPGVK